MQSKRPIESIQLATTVAKAVVLCNDQIHFFGLPAFEPVHVDILRPLRNALNFVLNETPVGQEPVGIAVIKRNSVAFWELGNKLRFLKVCHRCSIPLLLMNSEGSEHYCHSSPPNGFDALRSRY